MAKGKLPAFMMKGKDKTAGKKGAKPTFEKGKMPMFAKGGGIESKGKTKVVVVDDDDDFDDLIDITVPVAVAANEAASGRKKRKVAATETATKQGSAGSR